jgi:hypothetical protein
MTSELKPQKRSDRLVLSSLLTSGKLTSAEERAFRSMLEALDSGQVKLSPSQRMWVDQIFMKLKLDKKPDAKLVQSKTAKAAERMTTHPYDDLMKNRPLKPPGKS